MQMLVDMIEQMKGNKPNQIVIVSMGLTTMRMSYVSRRH